MILRAGNETIKRLTILLIILQTALVKALQNLAFNLESDLTPEKKPQNRTKRLRTCCETPHYEKHTWTLNPKPEQLTIKTLCDRLHFSRTAGFGGHSATGLHQVVTLWFRV